jgi:hypothetical protein
MVPENRLKRAKKVYRGLGSGNANITTTMRHINVPARQLHQLNERPTLSLELTTVISGGQTGVDQAALRAALQSGLTCAGWCPPGRACESGTIPLEFPQARRARQESVTIRIACSRRCL